MALSRLRFQGEAARPDRLAPIEDDKEMAQDMPSLIRKLEQIAGYRKLFDKAYPGEGISGATIGKALASYQRTVLSTESAFDRWRKGNPRAVSASISSIGHSVSCAPSPMISNSGGLAGSP